MGKPETDGFGPASKKNALSQAKDMETAMDSNYAAAKGKPNVSLPSSTPFKTPVSNTPAGGRKLSAGGGK